MPVASVVYDVGTSSIFILLYAFMLFLLLDVCCLIGVLPRQWLYGNWLTVAAVAFCLVAVFVYGNLNYHRKVRQELIVTTDKPLTNTQTLLIVSDLHLGYHNRGDEFRRWVELINDENPDAVLIVGDIIDRSLRPLQTDSVAAIFRKIKAPVYACLGNHEFYAGIGDAEQFYRDAGITLLRDEAVILNSGLLIVGRDDRTNKRRKKIEDIIGNFAQKGKNEGLPSDQSPFTILLDHQPYHLEEAEQAGIDYQFSGHTHHGQVWPISWITEKIYEKAFGEWQRGQTRYYVTSGLGIWGGKYRIGTRSEYVVLKISKK